MNRLWKMALVLIAGFSLTAGGMAVQGCSSVAGSCCKTCTVGKACGDTCIEASDTCHVGAGCACNG